MTLRSDDRRTRPAVPAQRTLPPGGPASGVVLTGTGGPPPARPAPVGMPTTADVAIGAVTQTLGAVRTLAGAGIHAGQQVLDRLPIPAGVRRRTSRVVQSYGRAGMRQQDELRHRVARFLDQAVPVILRELLARIDLTLLVKEYVDLDELVAAVDLDRAVARVDLDQAVERVDLDRILARVDLDAQVARVDLDRAVARVDLDRAVDRVDLDRAAARIDLDPILERADVVGLARYVIDVIDLPGIIRSSTGSMTSDVVRGARTQGADADEAVQRVVDRLLHRRRRDGAAPEGEP